MDQRSDHIRQDIESTRASLDEKLDSLETKARQAFDLKHQIAERPWMMLGAAVATGYVLGSLGGESGQSWQSQPASATGGYTQYGSTSDTNGYTQYGSTSSSPSYSSSQSSSSSKTDSLLSQFDDEISMLKVAGVNMLTNFLRDTIKEYVPALGQQIDKQLGQTGQSRSSGTVSTAPGASSYSDYEQNTSSINTEAIPTTTSYGSNLVDRGATHATPIYPAGSSATSQERSIGDDKTRY